MHTRATADLVQCVLKTATRTGVITRQYAHPDAIIQEVLRLQDEEEYEIASDSGSFIVLVKDDLDARLKRRSVSLEKRSK